MNLPFISVISVGIVIYWYIQSEMAKNIFINKTVLIIRKHIELIKPSQANFNFIHTLFSCNDNSLGIRKIFIGKRITAIE